MKTNLILSFARMKSTIFSTNTALYSIKVFLINIKKFIQP
jgi:hypothetical protein